MIRLLITLVLTSAGLANWPVGETFPARSGVYPVLPYRTNETPGTDDVGITRLEIPFQFNGQASALLVNVTYQLNTRKILATSSMVLSNGGKVVWANYIGPTADYTGEELTVLIGMKYTAPTNENTYVAGQSGMGDINGMKVAITLQNDSVKPQSAYMNGILHARFDVNGQNGAGRGTIQVNELSQPRYTYVIKPR